MIRAFALALFALLLSGCVGALAGATVGSGGPIQYSGDIAVSVTAGAVPQAGVTVVADFGAAEQGTVHDIVTQESDAQGRVSFRLHWAQHGSAHDKQGAYIHVRVWSYRQPLSVSDVIVRPGLVASLVLDAK